MNIKWPPFATLIVSEWKIDTGDYHLDSLLMQSPHKLVQCMCLQLPPKDLRLCYLQDFPNLKLTGSALQCAVVPQSKLHISIRSGGIAQLYPAV